MLIYVAGYGPGGSVNTRGKAENMHLFMAAAVQGYGAIIEPQLVARAGISSRLLSYAEVNKKADTFAYWLNVPLSEKHLFVDSGAYSASRSGQAINLDDYICWLDNNKQNITQYAGLDVIGNWKATGDNLITMEKAGLSPLPTFHYGSHQTELARLCEKYNYIALGGMVGIHRQKILAWLDTCFGMIYKTGWPKKIHAFGLTAKWALERYPFYSADSTSAIMAGAFGTVIRYNAGNLKSQHYTKELSAKLKTGSQTPYIERMVQNAIALKRYETYITNLWNKRGIEWR